MNLFNLLSKQKYTSPLLKKKGHFVVDDYVGISLLISTIYKETNDKYLIVTSNLYKAQKIYSLLCSFLSKDDVLLFPADELIRAETLAMSKEMVATRLYVLNEIAANKAKIVIANLASATRYLPDKELFLENVINIKKQSKYDLFTLKKQLIKAGYQLVKKVDQSLQFAVRGDILDIFSINYDNPIRIEFFDDEIEEIRLFDIATQESISRLDEVTILPASEFILSEEQRKNASDKILNILDKDKEILTYQTFEKLRDNTINDLEQISQGIFSDHLYKYYALLNEHYASLFSYCEDFVKVIVDENAINNANKMLFEDSFIYLNELHEDGKIISHLSMFNDVHKLINYQGCITTKLFIENEDDISFNVQQVPFIANKKEDCLTIIRNYINDNYRISIVISSERQLNALVEDLYASNIPFKTIPLFDVVENKIGLSLGNLESGFVLPEEKIVFLTGHELFNEKVKTGKYDSRFKEATILKTYEELEPGDYVVHEYQGIGQFIGLETIENNNKKTDYLKIAYRSDETLYVPLSQFQLVRKYLGKEGLKPRLSKLHSKDWENTKKRIKERVNDLAERLMKLYVERSKIKGFAFLKDDELQKQFEDNFDYELTRDQLKAVNDIKADMEKPYPMDRLLCGDVGFGKTEVSFRAIFKAILSGKQVALLCPTTLLARQHYEVAMKRFSPFDVKIALFSRLVSEKEQLENIELIKQGKIHLVIGTHRLLSKKIEFNDLGLLVIDEEQRFGVEQKERIKELKSNIDVLTLSATPIPRTLQISLLGVRSLSIINTAPVDRYPIQTYVTPYKEDIVKELIERELGRNGQVFYLHNNVSNLHICVSRLQKLLPGVSIGVAHGKMDKDSIEDVMMRFYSGDIQVLVCTSIIENGIDVPNANMIIVEDSQRYGLSQLYQIKGRVGRGNRIAYAYLMYSPNVILKEKAQKRLQALQEFTELGSGYKIAQRDLLIRGAGDILGPEQAGFIDSIGLDMYIKLLNEAVQEKLYGVKEEEIKENPTLSIEAFIPDEFAKDSDKIELYQEIISAPSLEALARIKNRTRDIFGRLPKEVEQLFKKRSIDLLVDEAKIESLTENKDFVTIQLSKEYINIRGIGNILFESMIPYLSKIKISYLCNVFKIVLRKKQSWVDDLENILNSLVNIIETHKIINVSI